MTRARLRLPDAADAILMRLAGAQGLPIAVVLADALTTYAALPDVEARVSALCEGERERRREGTRAATAAWRLPDPGERRCAHMGPRGRCVRGEHGASERHYYTDRLQT